MSSLLSVGGKVALVTGGGSGIMIAGTLVAEGPKTYIVGRSEATLAKAADELSGQGTCIAIPGDLEGGMAL